MNHKNPYKTKNYKTIFGLLVLLLVSLMACKKNYYVDTGKANAKFDGTIMQYLDSKPLYFDTLAKVIRLADMENVLKNEQITFFAPTDPTIQKAIDGLNKQLSSLGRDTVTKLEDIKPNAWKEMLSLYIFKGVNRLKDYTQIDTMALDTYAGQGYISYNNTPINIGVIYNDAVNGSVRVKYAGYRQLMISYIPDLTKPKTRWINTLISSSDINPTNGIVHVLKIKPHSFGFSSALFSATAIEKGIGN